ncbi:serine hydrolase domain-containing protein [Hoeflea sp. TYP-13]|uniref:serine hydrolase domain-containing protein n=1 Tax=Hoeflea sp. TYP-13 TaxID=3230023 RepID=UPI0034C6B282
MSLNAVNDPSSLGFDAGRLARIDRWMQRYVDERKFPGSSLLIARNGEIAHLAKAGRRSIEQDLPFELDTIVRIYSMTKPVTTVAVMMLVEQGHFHLDAPISAFLPEFSDCSALIKGAPAIDQLESAPSPTIHQLLTHTSGLSYDFNTGVLAEAYTQHGLAYSPGSGGLDKWVKQIAAMPLAFQPGSSWEYSVGIDVIGRLIEVVTGKPLDEFIGTEILEPLGMTDTAFSVADNGLDRFASCYTPVEGNPLRLLDEAATSEFRVGSVSTIGGGGGLVSTLADYFRFAEMLRLGGELEGQRLLSPRTVAFMRRNHLPGDIASMGPKSFAEVSMEGVGFGLGGAVVLDPAKMHTAGSVGDFSWGGLASTIFWTDPVEQLTVVFFTQLVPSSTYPNRAELKALVHAALTG